MNKNLDAMINEFKNRSLEKEYPVIWVDAVYEKVRIKGSVMNTAVMIIKAIDIKGKPDIIAVEVMENESEATYTELFNNLKKRGARKGMAKVYQMLIWDYRKQLKNVGLVLYGKDVKFIL